VWAGQGVVDDIQPFDEGGDLGRMRERTEEATELQSTSRDIVIDEIRLSVSISWQRSSPCVPLQPPLHNRHERPNPTRYTHHNCQTATLTRSDPDVLVQLAPSQVQEPCRDQTQHQRRT
jgi:hypothetical protein